MIATPRAARKSKSLDLSGPDLTTSDPEPVLLSRRSPSAILLSQQEEQDALQTQEWQRHVALVPQLRKLADERL